MDEHKNEQNQASESPDNSRELNQIKERYLYLQAEFDNYKKRIERERLSWIESAQDTVIIDTLSILDDAERAVQELQHLPEELSIHVTAVEMITKSLHKLFKKYDVEEIPPTKTFDPEYFEAVMQIASPEHTSGDIVTVLQKGYSRKGRILRPAKVSVAQ